MATVITEECINCGACEPECPNTAIFQGGVEFDLNGAKQGALNEEIFFIVPEKCTECVGFFDYEACAAVCPVDCCVPDPDRPETEDVLMVRAKELHPGKEFPEEFPSRFSPGRGAGDGGGDAAPAPDAAPAGVAAPAAAAAPAGGPAIMGRVERPVASPSRTLAKGNPDRDFDGELSGPYEEILDQATTPTPSAGSRLVGLLLLALSPALGALDHLTKKSLEVAYGDTRFFSSQLSTALNILQNFILYPVVFVIFGYFSGLEPFTEADRGWIMLGLGLALVETTIRLRGGIFGSLPADKMAFVASFYGAPLGLVLRPFIQRFIRGHESGHVPVEGFYTGSFEAKREREKRYGEVYTVREFDSGYFVRFDLPREIPPSASRDELGLGEEMPDYDLTLDVNDHVLTLKGSVVDPELRAVCGVSPAFPADFSTTIELAGAGGGFRHRYADKVLEVAVLKQAAG
jgi:ferredoxin